MPVEAGHERPGAVLARRDQPDALEAVAEEALKRGTGARGLRAILEEVLLDVMYDLPSRSDVARCVIDRAVVLEHMTPTLITSTPDRRSA